MRRGAGRTPPAPIRYALRSAVKRAELEALAIIGFGDDAWVSLDNASRLRWRPIEYHHVTDKNPETPQ